MTISSVLLTRFNTKSTPVGLSKVISDDWLTERLKVFASVTIPAIQRQAQKPDLWLVFFDSATSPLIRNRIEAISAIFPLFQPVFCDVLSADVYRHTIRQRLPSAADWLISTRIDNDDALHPSYLQQVYSSCKKGQREFLNPLHGLVIAGSKAYRKRDSSSPFISLSEPLEGFSTVWVDQHHLLKRHGPVRQLVARDSWIQLIHGDNVANQVRGMRARISTVDLSALPPALSAQLETETMADWAFDNTFGALKRYAGSARRFIQTRVMR